MGLEHHREIKHLRKILSGEKEYLISELIDLRRDGVLPKEEFYGIIYEHLKILKSKKDKLDIYNAFKKGLDQYEQTGCEQEKIPNMK